MSLHIFPLKVFLTFEKTSSSSYQGFGGLSPCCDQNMQMNAFPLPQGHIFRRPKLPSHSTSERRVLYNSVISTLARLHSVDWRSLGLSDFGHHTNYVRRQVRLLKMSNLIRNFTSNNGKNSWKSQISVALPIINSIKNKGLC